MGLAVSAATTPSDAQDFFSFFGFEAPRQRMSYAPDNPYEYAPRRRVPRAAMSSGGGGGGGGSQAYCVRTCDGRYFPLSVSDNASAACEKFCPGTEMSVYRGGTIDNARSDKGKSYSDLPNAFRFRKELVQACTCNGKTTGLAPVRLEDDPTLKRGDLVASEQGLMVSSGSDKRGAALKLTPAPAKVAAQLGEVVATNVAARDEAGTESSR